MYLLDTNVVSELRKSKEGKADLNVTAWARSVSSDALFVSVITLLELEMGILSLERRDSIQGAILRVWMEAAVLPSFVQRILPVDTSVARRCAQLHVPDRQADRDALIAATALVHGLTVVTRNLADFSATGVTLLNPWLPST